jgi:hypothetical protein
MKRSITFSAIASAPIIVGIETADAQSRVASEAGRGFPYSSGGAWSWGPWILLFVLVLIFIIAGALQERLRDQSWWHTLIVMLATVLSSIALSIRVSQPYSADRGLVIFMLIPSFAGIALLYLAVMGLIQAKHDKGSR